MLKLTTQELIDEFFNEHYQTSDLLKGLTREQIEQIVVAQFAYARKEMASEEMPTIRLKYLCTFTVYPKRVKYRLDSITKEFKENNIAPEIFFKQQKKLKNFLENAKDFSKEEKDFD